MLKRWIIATTPVLRRVQYRHAPDVAGCVGFDLRSDVTYIFVVRPQRRLPQRRRTGLSVLPPGRHAGKALSEATGIGVWGVYQM
jgi:hypothetical protein